MSSDASLLETLSTEALVEQAHAIFNELRRRSSLAKEESKPLQETSWSRVTAAKAEAPTSAQHVTEENDGLVIRHACGLYQCACKCFLRPTDNVDKLPAFDLTRLHIAKIPVHQKYEVRTSIVNTLCKHGITYSQLYLPDDIPYDAQLTVAIITFTSHVNATAAQGKLQTLFAKRGLLVNFFRRRPVYHDSE